MKLSGLCLFNMKGTNWAISLVVSSFEAVGFYLLRLLFLLNKKNWAFQLRVCRIGSGHVSKWMMPNIKDQLASLCPHNICITLKYSNDIGVTREMETQIETMGSFTIHMMAFVFDSPLFSLSFKFRRKVSRWLSDVISISSRFYWFLPYSIDIPFSADLRWTKSIFFFTFSRPSASWFKLLFRQLCFGCFISFSFPQSKRSCRRSF